MSAEERSELSAAEFSERLRASGEEREVGGNEPFTLSSPDTAWLVVAGHVEIFAVNRGEGRRTHLATLGPGRLLFGVGSMRRSMPFGTPTEAEESDLELVAVGLRGARLVELGLDRLRALAREPELVPGLARRIERWLDHLFEKLHQETPPKVFEVLEAGEEVVLEEEGAVARPRAGVVWARHVAGASRFLGHDSLSMKPAGFLLPVSRTTWLVAAAAPTRISCVETALLLKGGGLWEGLARFHDLFLDYVSLMLERASAKERERLHRRLELDQRTVESASRRLASVLGSGRELPVEPDETDDPLLTACRLVAGAQDLEIQAPPSSEREERRSDPLSRIMSASRLRMRRVLLRDDWWCRDNGPLLGYRLEDEEDLEGPGQPVALLPTSVRSYEMVDPVARTRTPVTEEVANGLKGEAFMFYPPLPDRKVGPLDLVRMSLRGRGRDLTTLALVGAAGGILAMLMPIVTSRIFGQIIPGADRTQLGQLTVALFVAALATAAFEITRGIAVLRVGGKIDGSTQAAVWDRLMRLPIGFFRRFTVGDLANRSMGIDQIRELMTGNVTTSILSAVFSVFSFALLFYYSWKLALVATALVGVLLGITGLLAWLQLRHKRALLELQGKLASLLFGLIHGIGKLRIAGAEHRAYALWAERFTEQRRRTIQARRAAILQQVFNAVYGVLTTLTLFAVVGLALRQDLPLAEFLAFNAAFGQFQAAALSSIGVIPELLTVVPLYERLSPVLKAVPEVDETKTEAGELAGAVEFAHVSFRYQEDGPLILDDVSIKAAPGEFVALVGPSGSGKSTCLRLILGFEEPDSGSIYFDGMDLPSLDIQSVRRQIGVVLQSGQPLVGSIFSNIVGSSNLTIDDAWEAAEMAGLAEDIKAMPMGMHTVVSEGAGTFSGGQKQRLLIARAIVHRPRIVLFDEATSALDNRTQETVSRSLERLKATRIVIAHRLSTIIHADRIYVMDRGRVIEHGGYDELVAQGGLFSRLVERQTA